MSGFRKFLLRGNVVDLAIAVVIGAAFTAIVTALVGDFITPLIGILVGKNSSFEDLTFSVRGSQFGYGDFINKVISFVLIAAVVYFLVVLPVQRLLDRFKPSPDEPTPTKTCPECLSSIPSAATRCAFCTVEQPATA